MWHIYLISPVLNLDHKKGATLMACGLVRTDELLVTSCDGTLKDAKRECLRLAVQTLYEHGYDTTVIGYGVRPRLSKRAAPLEWQVTLQQAHVAIAKMGYKRNDLPAVVAA